MGGGESAEAAAPEKARHDRPARSIITPAMKTDETSRVRSGPTPPRDRRVTQVTQTPPGTAPRGRGGDKPGFDLNAQDGRRKHDDADQGAAHDSPMDVAAVHGVDVAHSPDRVRDALAQLTAEVAQLNESLQAARARIAHLDGESRLDPRAGVLHGGAFCVGLQQVARLDRSEGIVSSVVLIEFAAIDAARGIYGFAGADRMIGAVGKTLADAAVAGEVVGYLGGGVFAVILTATPPEGAEARVRALYDATRAYQDSGSAWRHISAPAPPEDKAGQLLNELGGRLRKEPWQGVDAAPALPLFPDA